MIIKEQVLTVFEGKNGGVFKRSEIIDRVVQKYPGTNPKSIIPSDYCYNLINLDIEKGFRDNESNKAFHVFEYLGNATYKYLGEHYSYDGPIRWKKTIKGQWKNGKIIELKKLERGD